MTMIVYIVLLGVIGLSIYSFIDTFITSIKQLNCKHDRYFETRSCTAYCMNCEKKLGFIGEVRKDSSKKEIWLGQPFDKDIGL